MSIRTPRQLIGRKTRICKFFPTNPCPINNICKHTQTSPKLLEEFWKPTTKSKTIRILLFPLVQHSRRRVLSIPWLEWETQKPRGRHPQSESKTPGSHPGSLCNRQHQNRTEISQPSSKFQWIKYSQICNTCSIDDAENFLTVRGTLGTPWTPSSYCRPLTRSFGIKRCPVFLTTSVIPPSVSRKPPCRQRFHLIRRPLVPDKTADVEIRICSDAWTTSYAVSLLFRTVRQMWGSQTVAWKGRSEGKPRKY